MITSYIKGLYLPLAVELCSGEGSCAFASNRGKTSGGLSARVISAARVWLYRGDGIAL